MFCKNCGTQLPENSSFCPSCGTAVATPQPEYTTAPQAQPIEEPVNQQTYEAPAQPAQPVQPVTSESSSVTKVFVLSIIGAGLVAFASLWVSSIFTDELAAVFFALSTAVAGLVISIIARNSLNGMNTAGECADGKLKVAAILSKIGFIAGFVIAGCYSLAFTILSISNIF